MRLLVDANLAPLVAARLRDTGHEAVHVYDVGLAQSSDEQIVEYAFEHDCVIVSSDTDFAAIRARLVRSRHDPSAPAAVRERVTIGFHDASMARADEHRRHSQLFAADSHRR